MFEDALVESSGKLKSRSKYWMIATLAFNLTAVATLILIPLLHPEALPRAAMVAMLTAPPPPPPASRPSPRVVRATRTVEPLNAMIAPSAIPHKLDLSRETPPPTAEGAVMDGSNFSGTAPSSGVLDALGAGTVPEVVAKQPDKQRPRGPLNISSGVATGALLAKVTPVYPAIAKAARVSGTIVLHAVISKAGSIESLQVVSGPQMLRPSAVDAVRQWRYRPYLLNGEPTDVETTITVNFALAG